MQVRVAGGQWRAGVAKLDHRVHGPELVGEQPPGFRHVAGIPVDAVVWHVLQFLSIENENRTGAILDGGLEIRFFP